MKASSWATDELLFAGSLSAEPTSSLLRLDGRYGPRRLAGSVDYKKTGEFQHAVSALLAHDEDSPLFQATLTIDAGHEKRSLSLDVQAGRRVTLDVQLTSTTARVELFWNKDLDPTARFDFSGRLTHISGFAQLQCAGRPPLRLEFERLGNVVKVHATWRGDRAVSLLLERQKHRTTGEFTTPFAGLERVTFDAQHECTSEEIDAQVYHRFFTNDDAIILKRNVLFYHTMPRCL